MPKAPPPRLARLPDFCSLPIVFAMLLVAGLAVSVIALAPAARFDWRGFSTGAAFAAWLALINAVVLCKLRRPLLRLPGVSAFAGVWALIVLVAFAGASVVGWLDHALDMRLTGVSTLRFVTASTAISALIGAALLRYFHMVAQWQARQAAGARAQVEALQARIQPHFLFNSMNTVAALVRVDADAAETTVENLCELFRAALGSGDTHSTLGDELALVERYLAIESLRLGPRLRVQRHLDNLPAAMPMPRLLLQPLLENAIRHGIQVRREGGTVSLHGRYDSGALELRIGNPAPPADAVSTGHGHALDNVRQRIGYHFGPRARLDIQHHDGRIQVRLRLPWRNGDNA